MATTKQTVLITGCSPGGIGHSLAKEFHSKGKTSYHMSSSNGFVAVLIASIGLRVFATARKTASIDDLEALGIETFSLEVTVPESIETLKNDINRLTGGKLDILVNNA
jgi:1-acylglycerone phosphate reductase